MKKQTLILVFGLLVNPSYAQQINIKQANQFDKMLSEQFKNNETGATVLVARNGLIAHKKAFRMSNLELGVPMKVDQVFRIGFMGCCDVLLHIWGYNLFFFRMGT